MYPIEPVLKPDQHEYHTGHIPRQKLATFTGPLQVAHRSGQPLQSALVNDVAVVPYRAQMWAPSVTRYTAHYSKVENYYDVYN